MTYNILIDVYGKSGAWQEAVKVLDALQAQVSPDTMSSCWWRGEASEKFMFPCTQESLFLRYSKSPHMLQSLSVQLPPMRTAFCLSASLRQLAS